MYIYLPVLQMISMHNGPGDMVLLEAIVRMDTLHDDGDGEASGMSMRGLSPIRLKSIGGSVVSVDRKRQSTWFNIHNDGGHERDVLLRYLSLEGVRGSTSRPAKRSSRIQLDYRLAQ